MPASGAVPLPAHVSRLVGIVAAIVVEIAHPQFGYAFAVLTSKLRFFVALSVVADGGVFVRAVFAVGVAVALPAVEDATPVGSGIVCRLQIVVFFFFGAK